MSEQPIAQETITAMSRLNSYVRSNSYYRPYSTNLKYIIYRYKMALLVGCVKAGVTQSRLVMVRATCRTCGGRGYYGWDNDNTCWTCHGAGWVALEFIETRLPGEVIFHTPYGPQRSAPAELQMTIRGQQPAWVSDWKPNQDGIDLEPGDLAEALNIVEAWFYGDRFPVNYIMGRHGGDEDDVWYRLPVGKIDTCSWCGAPGEITFTRDTHLLRWIESSCHKCRYKHPFELSPKPDQLLAPTSVQTWLARRAAWEVKTNE